VNVSPQLSAEAGAPRSSRGSIISALRARENERERERDYIVGLRGRTLSGGAILPDNVE